MTTVADHRWLTVRETAALIRVSEDTVRRAIASGELPAVQLGGRGSSIRIDEAELECWLFAGSPVALGAAALVHRRPRGELGGEEGEA